MVVLLSKTLNPWKRVWYAIQTFEGIGLSTAKTLCSKALIHPQAKVKDLNEEHLAALKALLQPRLEQERQNKLFSIRAAKKKPKPIFPK